MNKRPSRLPYLPALDGIRGISILAVLFFHAGFVWMKGGYLGVEVFFVVSGYLITSLLLSEYLNSKSISLKNFWKRRAKRLLPALFVLLASVIIICLVAIREELPGLRGDTIAALFYVENWHLILTNQSYFSEIGRPSLLQHLWSLAIEEQFYLIWPILILFLLRTGRKFISLRKIALITLGVAISSQIWSLIVSSNFGIDRAYLGTDTRLTGLLIGASLALYIRPSHIDGLVTETKMQKIYHNTLLMVAVLVLVCSFIFVSPSSTFPYKGGFLIISGAVSVLIIGLSIGGSLFSRLFTTAPFIYLGTRSYSLYLWHWPVFQFLRPGIDTKLDFWVVTMIRFLVTFFVAELSYRIIELPMRRQVLPSVRFKTKPTSYLRLASVSIALILTLSFVTRPSVIAGTWLPNEYLAELRATKGELGEQGSVSISSTLPISSSLSPPEIKHDELKRPEGLITIVGDSVTLGAGKTLINRIGSPVVLNAETNRQPASAVEVIRNLAVSEQLGSTVVIAVGWNGPIKESHFEEIMKICGETRRVFWVIPSGDRSWISESMSLLRRKVPDTTGAKYVEWDKFSANHPDWFASDGIHVTGEGVNQFADSIFQAIAVM